MKCTSNHQINASSVLNRSRGKSTEPRPYERQVRPPSRAEFDSLPFGTWLSSAPAKCGRSQVVSSARQLYSIRNEGAQASRGVAFQKVRYYASFSGSRSASSFLNRTVLYVPGIDCAYGSCARGLMKRRQHMLVVEELGGVCPEAPDLPEISPWLM